MTDPVTAEGGKAANLRALSAIENIAVPRFIVLSADAGESSCRAVLAGFLRESASNAFAVRSSACNEDSHDASFAGMYETKLGVPAEIGAIMEAVRSVRASASLKSATAESYAAARGIASASARMDVIVQEMILPEISGVILSHSLSARDGYFVISSTNGLGDAVASGSVNGRLMRVMRCINPNGMSVAWLAELVRSMKAIERHFKSKSMDVEFAYQDETLYILQARPITIGSIANEPADEERQRLLATKLDRFVNETHEGDVLGDMIDINPRELLGENPSALDVSVFRYLFADEIVERVRREMGYDPLDLGLLRVVAGKPYVSLWASAFSMRPTGLPDAIYERMYQVYRHMLRLDPGLQNRVEFDVFAMGSGPKLESVMDAAQFSDDERACVRLAFDRLGESLLSATARDRDQFGSMAHLYGEAIGTQSGLKSLLAHAAVGTEAFVRVARLAFYWKSRFEEEYPGVALNDLLAGRIHTVSGRLKADLRDCKRRIITREELVNRYGHLRPGQFRMFGHSYADDPEHYLFSQLHSKEDVVISVVENEAAQSECFAHALFFMQAREDMKFLFSRALHRFIVSLQRKLHEAGISEENASRAKWQDLVEALEECKPLRLDQVIETLPVMPEVIVPGATRFDIVESASARPTFITHGVVKAPVCVMTEPDVHADVRGKIVLVPNADPGFDFLFHARIAGIVTRNGGPASHMCIRAVELQIPACIGAGESVFRSVSLASHAVLDCEQGQIILTE